LRVRRAVGGWRDRGYQELSGTRRLLAFDRIVLSKVTAREISFGKSPAWGYAHTIRTDNGWGAADALKSDKATASLRSGQVLLLDGASGRGKPRPQFAASILDAVPDAKFELVNSSANRRHGSIERILSGTDHRLYKIGNRFSVRGVTNECRRKPGATTLP
jgi:hypothetical protein